MQSSLPPLGRLRGRSIDDGVYPDTTKRCLSMFHRCLFLRSDLVPASRGSLRALNVARSERHRLLNVGQLALI